MIEPKDFERLERTVKTIATHREYPGRQMLVRVYLDAIRGTLAARPCFVVCAVGKARVRSPGGPAWTTCVRTGPEMLKPPPIPVRFRSNAYG